MNPIESPQFSNTCGKIYANRIIIASAYREKEVLFKDIKKVRFSTRPEFKSLLFIALPCVLFFFPMLVSEEDIFATVLFIVLGVLFTGVSIVKMDKKHAINMKLQDGTTMLVTVKGGNEKEAKKFADTINSKLLASA